MSQIITVKTDIKNFKSLESAAKALGYSILGNEAKIEMKKDGRILMTASRDGESYSIVGDSDWMNRGRNNLLNELKNEYAKEEAVAWAKYTGRTVTSIKGNAKTGYDIEISA